MPADEDPDTPPHPGTRVSVLGPGGVGGLLAALLSRAGADVTCLAGRDTVEELNRSGVHVRSAQFGDFDTPVRAAQTLQRPTDVCFITVKATQLDAALGRLPVDLDSLVVPLLNGVEHVQTLRNALPRAGVVAATIRVEANKPAPGQVVHASPFTVVELAPPAALRTQSEALADRLRSAGLEVRVADDEATTLWSKLAFLAPFALLTTDRQAIAGDVRQHGRSELTAVVAEVAAVARAEGARSDEDATLRFFDQVPAGMRSSMQRDAAEGRRTELDAIGGAVLRAAAWHDIEVPVTAALVDRLYARYEAS